MICGEHFSRRRDGARPSIRASMMRKWLCAALVAFTTVACQTAWTPGSAYRLTGSIEHLLAEPTFDVGADPAAARFYSFRVPHYNADGHGLFDVPMVVSEQLLFAPTWVFSGALRLTGTEQFLGGPRPPGIGGFARSTVSYLIGIPGTACFLTSLTGAMAFDVVAHDVPVIFVGRPLRWLASAAAM